MALGIAALAVAVASAVAAGCAVVISKKALAWQQVQDIARVTPEVRIEFDHDADPRSPTGWFGDDPRPLPLEYRLTVSVINTGQTTEHLRRLRIGAADHSEERDLRPVGADEEIQPRARFQNIVPLGDIPKWESGFVAIATLADGEQVESAIERADADRLAHIEQHNRGARR